MKIESMKKKVFSKLMEKTICSANWNALKNAGWYYYDVVLDGNKIKVLERDHDEERAESKYTYLCTIHYSERIENIVREQQWFKENEAFDVQCEIWHDVESGKINIA